jgi:hypothetical protein
MTRIRSDSLPLAAFTLLLVGLLLAGCGGESRTSAQFLESTTAPTPGLVKLVASAVSGNRVVVDVVMHGPEPDLDLNAFRFGVQVDNPALLRFAPQSSFLQTALVAGEGQTIAIDVQATEDPSLVVVETQKRGGGAGNGFASATAIVIELSFEILGEGTASLSLVGVDGNPPLALDPTRTPIDGVVFDAESAHVVGVTVGGGY